MPQSIIFSDHNEIHFSSVPGRLSIVCIILFGIDKLMLFLFGVKVSVRVWLGWGKRQRRPRVHVNMEGRLKRKEDYGKFREGKGGRQDSSAAPID